MKVHRIDHFVLTVADVQATCDFYARVLGMKPVSFDGRWALAFGRHKINLHQAGHEFEPKAARPTPGSGDFCLITDVPIADVVRHLEAEAVTIEVGPVERTGAEGPIVSVYFRDPDGNLVEVANSRLLPE
jgi:catechol 2,3-dioxygenase-like lactoylglutathione lyase family enzyme